VRKYEFEMGKAKADLNYAPCKGQVVLVIAGPRGTMLRRAKGSDRWGLPSGRIGACEDPLSASKRIARECCDLGLRSLELAGMYDVTWHYSDISMKRLHLVYSAKTDDEGPAADKGGGETRYFADIPDDKLESDLVRDAISDCREK
jgi:ADP-ribose pyrophosphatase YjhB (NUDIX family)